MAKAFEELDKVCSQIVSDTEAKKFAPVYLLMGDEDYYVDLVCNAVISNAFDDESENGFFGGRMSQQIVVDPRLLQDAKKSGSKGIFILVGVLVIAAIVLVVVLATR